MLCFLCFYIKSAVIQVVFASDCEESGDIRPIKDRQVSIKFATNTLSFFNSSVLFP